MIIKKFEELARRYPLNIAIKTVEKQITYQQLNSYANGVANEIVKSCNKAFDTENSKVIVLLFEHGADMIVGTMGALKSNKTYVPFDPNYPINRLKYMLINSGADLIVTNSKNIKLAMNLMEGTGNNGSVLNIDEINFSEQIENLQLDIYDENIMYILYTSGSTGKPKGIMQTQKNVLHFINCYTNTLSITKEDKMTLFSAFSHDAAIMDIYGALLNGATLYPLNIKEIVNINEIACWLQKEEITIWHSVPTIYRYFVNALTEEEAYPKLRFIVLGGESIISHDVEMFKKFFKHTRLVNLYGQTESSYNSSKIFSHDSKSNKLTLGEPVDETEILVVDENKEEVLPLRIGEIVILSNYIAHGYWKDEEKTKEVFKHGTEIGCLYWTGDLGRLLEDGSVEFIGRKDSVIKIRGYRVDSGDIESNLLNHEDIKEAVVLGKEDIDKNNYLCAYFVADKEVMVSELREYLAANIPDYMIPSYFIQLDKMPLTPNGKIDRNGFPEPNKIIELGEGYEGPRTEVEEKLMKLWCEVLGVNKLGINDNFFQLGGHSLKATMLSAKIHKELAVEVSIREIFKAQTIKGLSEYIKSVENSIYQSIKPAEQKEYYEASSAQKRIYMLQQLNLQGTGYNMPKVMTIEGRLDLARLEESINELIRRHESLRTSFEIIGDIIVQRVVEDINFKIEYIEEKYDEVGEAVKEFVKAFDLSKTPLLRVGITKVEEEKHILMFDMHHIISDGLSMTIMINEIANLYEGKSMETLRVQYKDYAEWQNALLKSEVMKKQEEYWVNRFSDEIPVLNLRADYVRPAMQSFEGDSISFKLNKKVTSNLRRIAKETGSTMYMVLLSGFNILLSKYSGQEDIIVGTPIAGRPHADLEKIIGMFVNTLAMRNYPEGNKTYEEFLKNVKENALKAYENQDYQFEGLVEKLNISRDISRNPLFDVMFTLQNIDSEEITLEGLSFKGHKQEKKIAKFDLNLSANETNDEIALNLEYSTKLFAKETIGRMVEDFTNILKVISTDIKVKLSEIEMLTEVEKHELIYGLNDTYADYPRDKTINQLFEEQVEKSPDNIAVVFKEKQLTYRELNESANKLARTLREKGVKADSVVAIMVDRSLEMITGIMGILKAGGAYLPISSEYPEERKRYILKDSKAELLITQSQMLEGTELDIECVDINHNDMNNNSPKNLEQINNSDSIAYVIYTSGSTGNPKGVLIEHRNVVSLTASLTKMLYEKVEGHLNIALVAPYVFDASVQQVFPAILMGHSLFVVDGDVRKDGTKLVEFYKENSIDISDGTPTHINMLSNVKNLYCEDITVKYFIIGGDILPCKTVKKFINKFEKKKPKIINIYGPTECCVDSIYYLIDYDKLDKFDSIPIGKPMANEKIYILDKNKKLVSKGICGEIYISGDGVAREYLNKPELTAEKFIENPFETGKKMYRTGDLGRWLSDGNIEFLGRIDHQVKIRGFRIELGEIENQLLNYEVIKEAIVLDREDESGNKYLCAYVTADKELTVGELRAHLGKKLPDYMIPSYFVHIEKVPLTSSGKIDRKALPEPDRSVGTGTKYEAPRNDLEEKLAVIWQEVLGAERVGIRDNFLELGGDSIKAIQVMSRLKKYGYSLEMKDLFKNPLISELSRFVKQTSAIIEQGIVEGEVELIPIQKWFFEQNFTNMNHWNQAVMIYNKNGFDEEILRKIFDKILIHHDALRMVYEISDEGIKQNNRDINKELYSFDNFDFNGKESYEEEITSICSKIQSSIDLNNGPLMKLALFKRDEGDHLLIAVHHLVIDGVSWRILFEDLATAYKQVLKNEEIVFQEKTSSYKEWSKALKEYGTSKKALSEFDYWSEIESTEVKLLPKDYEINDRKIKDIKSVSIILSKEETEELLKNTNRAYNTEINDILLTALGLTIKKWTSENKVLINLEGHGRETLFNGIDITRTIGWFTIQYPVILDMEKSDDISYQIKSIKESLRHIPNKGIGYGILKYLTDKEFKKDVEFKLKPEISFNYLGQFDEDIPTGIFEISRISSGEFVSCNSESQYAIDVSGMIAGGKLNMSFRYNQNEYSEDTILSIGKDYRKIINEVINHCVSKKTIELTPTDFGDKELSIEELEVLKDVYKDGEELRINNIYPLSSMQEGMLFHFLRDEQSSAYFERIILDINGEMDIKILEESFNMLVDRYDILRTIFAYEGLKMPRQIVFNKRKTNIHFEDISELGENDKLKYVEEFISKDMKRGFDLTKDILIRISILKIGQYQYKVVWSNHHILMDGWCLGIIFGDLFKIYHGIKSGCKVELQQTHPYMNYINWLKEQDKEEAKEYWRKYLAEYESKAIIPRKASKTDQYRYEQKEYIFKLDKDLTKEIERESKNNQVTVNSVIQAIWGILLQRYNNIDDVVYGAVVSGRNSEIEGIENMVGLFINTVPIRVKCSEKMTFKEMVSNLHQNIAASSKYDYYPLAEIQSSSSLKQNLIDNIMVFENYPVNREIEETSSAMNIGFNIDNVEAREQTNYDFSIKVVPKNEITVSISFNEAVYDKEFIEKIGQHFINVAKCVVKNNEILVKDIEILTEEEKHKLIYEFNDTYADYPRDKTVHELFEDQVERMPDNIAVVFEGKQLTYRELNEKANRLARTLREKGVKPNSIVGIVVERSLEMAVSIIGILKAGAAYLPIDPEYPEDRIKFTIENSKASIIITQKQFINKINNNLYVIDVEDENAYACNGENLENLNAPNNLAYIIYTSGTTGIPKGVMIEHRNIVRLMFNERNLFDFNEKDVWTMFHSYCFDFSVWEMYGALLYGGKLIIVSRYEAKDTAEYLKILKKEKVTVLNQIPTPFYNLANEELKSSRGELKLRYVIFGGEALKPGALREWRDVYPNVKLINMYGITETTVHVTFKEINDDDIKINVSNVGRPIPTLTTYIMDKNMRLQPIGVAGELCVGGEGVARGYLYNNELTDYKFVYNPYKINERIYRSGDLARILPSGDIEYLGRIDHQVKIRGYRIELGEIENHLLSYDEIKESVVVDKEDKSGRKYLCAYLVANKKLTVEKLREHLSTKLPGYMIPSYFVQVEKMPLTLNGKINIKALPEPNGERVSTEENYVAPSTLTEKTLVEIWTKVLKVNKIGIHDNFFNLGGDSILSIQIVSRAKEKGLDISVQQVFQYPTIWEMAAQLNISKPEVISKQKTQAFSLLSEKDRAKLFKLNNREE